MERHILPLGRDDNELLSFRVAILASLLNGGICRVVSSDQNRVAACASGDFIGSWPNLFNLADIACGAARQQEH